MTPLYSKSTQPNSCYYSKKLLLVEIKAYNEDFSRLRAISSAKFKVNLLRQTCLPNAFKYILPNTLNYVSHMRTAM